MDRLSQSVRVAASETGFSGVVHSADANHTLPAEAFGLAHRGLEVPNTVATQFAIASGGKGFTALAAISLIAEGTVSLDTTARSVLGADLPLIAEDVTVEHLLGHRSGIGDHLDEEAEDEDPEDYVLASPVNELDTTEASASAALITRRGRPTPPGRGLPAGTGTPRRRSGSPVPGRRPG